jgi:prevent-host-death family protein
MITIREVVEMREIGLFEAKQKLSELVERAGRGERIGITRRGKLTAVIGPAQADTDLDELFEGMEKIRRRAKSLRGATLKDLIEEGRM